MIYLWLAHRDVPTAATNGRRGVDVEQDVARKCGDVPNMLMAADLIW